MCRHAVGVLIILFTTLALAGPTKKSDRVEKSVKRALHYLHKTQEDDGAWRLMGNKSTAATSLAVMAFLSAGHVPGEGPFGATVEKGVRWVLAQQNQNGLLADYRYAMYQHGISTLMLAEVAGMTSKELSPKLKAALEKSIRFLLKAQRKGGAGRGGWRYDFAGYDADLSVTGWQLLALRAAKNLGCDIPAERIDLAMRYVHRCHDSSSGGFRYQPGGQLTIACTGTGILCLELCEKHHSKLALRAGALLLKNPPHWQDPHFFYAVYYCSQANFQLGGNYWEFYCPRFQRILFEYQDRDGSWPGSKFGRAYATAMSVLALTVEYRFLPIYQRGDDSEKGKK